MDQVVLLQFVQNVVQELIDLEACFSGKGSFINPVDLPQADNESLDRACCGGESLRLIRRRVS